MRVLIALLLVPLTLFALACNGDDDGDATATSIPSVAAPAESPVAESTATTVPAASPTSEPTTAPTATSEPTLPPTDGTVFPQNPGSTDAFDIKSLPDPNIGIYVLNDVRVGAHPESGGWDRIVFEFEPVDGFPGAHPGGIVEYVDEASQCGSGEPVEVEGEAILRVKLDATQAHDDNGNLTIDAIEIEGPGNSIVEAVSFCDFEGFVEWAIGVPAEQNFKVEFLQDPARIVIDIKWP
jgi:hypothetical protein